MIPKTMPFIKPRVAPRRNVTGSIQNSHTIQKGLKQDMTIKMAAVSVNAHHRASITLLKSVLKNLPTSNCFTILVRLRNYCGFISTIFRA